MRAADSLIVQAGHVAIEIAAAATSESSVNGTTRDPARNNIPPKNEQFEKRTLQAPLIVPMTGNTQHHRKMFSFMAPVVDACDRIARSRLCNGPQHICGFTATKL